MKVKLEEKDLPFELETPDFVIHLSESIGGSGWLSVLQKKRVCVSKEKCIDVHSTGTIEVNDKIVYKEGES